MVGKNGEVLINCTSLTPLIKLVIVAVLVVVSAITPPVGDVMPPARIIVEPNPVSAIVTLELKLNDVTPLIVGLNGPETKSQKPFCWVEPSCACGPASTVTVELNGASKPLTVSAVTVKVNG